MTPAEKYYAFLDRVSPMNLLLVADLDRALDIGRVAECWPHFVRERALPRVQVRPDLTIGDGGPGQIDFVGLTLPSTEWDAQLSRESREPFGTDRPMRCLYLASPDENRSRLAFVVHHAIVDGRVGIAELQAFIRALDGQDLPSETRPPLVLAPTKVLPWQRDRRLLGAVVQEIRARNEGVGPGRAAGVATPTGPAPPAVLLADPVPTGRRAVPRRGPAARGQGVLGDGGRLAHRRRPPPGRGAVDDAPARDAGRPRRARPGPRCADRTRHQRHRPALPGRAGLTLGTRVRDRRGIGRGDGARRGRAVLPPDAGRAHRRPRRRSAGRRARARHCGAGGQRHESRRRRPGPRPALGSLDVRVPRADAESGHLRQRPRLPRTAGAQHLDRRHPARPGRRRRARHAATRTRSR